MTGWTRTATAVTRDVILSCTAPFITQTRSNRCVVIRLGVGNSHNHGAPRSVALGDMTVQQTRGEFFFPCMIRFLHSLGRLFFFF